ncbi:MAG: PQ-loop repeat-containing protein [Muribaculaceae bacterium]|nr:PQ-loop repeat-containing protein [Muribaculaceae bacterium]
METRELIITIIGYAASICMILGYLPQAIYTIRTRNTDGIALSTFILMGLGAIFFMVQGIMVDLWSLIITNAITSASSLIIFSIKIYNDHFRKK